LIFLASIAFVIVGIGKSIFLLPFVFIALYLYQIGNIKVGATLQHQISSNQRATIFSIKSLIFELIYMLFVVVFGVVGDKLGVMKILVFSGGFISIMLLVFMFIENKLSNTVSTIKA